ncbi:MAG: precorrin-6y C5,15-methyltransferase (decarboxylating) subunit CbiE [Desulfococcaceae bacterium]|jgi:precorrin-6Y C5,15-methyltransferase (decarboxylating)|nr:precorrin-6y C5,15-methyltransferase (decarboxylating) subunit CbiE [Desulfococcaceae bacterium]
MNPVSVIGMGLSPKDLTAAHWEKIRSADILMGGKRHLSYFEDFPGQKKEIDKNLKELTEFIRENMFRMKIAVLASGDPLYYGIGSYLIKMLGPESVRIYPNISSVSAAFARIKTSWQDARLLSMHGKYDEDELLSVLKEEKKIALLTDPRHSPAWLARFLMEKRMKDFRICVLEQLGMDGEQVQWYSPEEAAEKEFAEPNLVILLKDGNAESRETELFFGMPDENFEHQKGLITKAEVRAVTLSKLRLSSPDLVLWDLGAGSGSVSVEASFLLPKGKIYALEQHPERIAQIRQNKERFRAYQVEVVQAVLPEGLETLPGPDRIFIGGGGKNLENIIRISSRYIREKGIMVINTVLLQNIQTASDTLADCGFSTEIVQIQISSGRPMPWGRRLAAQNPVWIISGFRQ